MGDEVPHANCPFPVGCGDPECGPSMFAYIRSSDPHPSEAEVREKACREVWALREVWDRRDPGGEDPEVSAAMRALFQACRRIDEATTRRLRNEAARLEPVARGPLIEWGEYD